MLAGPTRKKTSRPTSRAITGRPNTQAWKAAFTTAAYTAAPIGGAGAGSA